MNAVFSAALLVAALAPFLEALAWGVPLAYVPLARMARTFLSAGVVTFLAGCVAHLLLSQASMEPGATALASGWVALVFGGLVALSRLVIAALVVRVAGACRARCLSPETGRRGASAGIRGLGLGLYQARQAGHRQLIIRPAVCVAHSHEFFGQRAAGNDQATRFGRVRHIPTPTIGLLLGSLPLHGCNWGDCR